MLEAERAWIRAALQRHVDRTGQQLEVGDPVPLQSNGFEFISALFTVEARKVGRTVSLIVKILPLVEMQHYLSARQQYRNECLFYGDFLRFVLVAVADEKNGLDAIESLFPKLFCAHEDEDGQCLLALENLALLGFKNPPKILDLDHMKLALRELGKLHALSYIAKKKNPKKFFDVVKRFNPWVEEDCRQFNVMIRGMVQFAVELFENAYPEDGEKYAGRLAKLGSLADEFWRLTVPEEPLAVLCHGDYNRNNLMFGYDDTDGRPVSLKIIDFQLATYSSPAVDLSLLLFLSTSAEVRDAHWDELLEAYRSSLLDTMQLSLRCTRDVVEEEYSVDVLAHDFAKFCKHGFLVTVFFLPATMMEPEDCRALESEAPVDNTPERVEALKRLCSDEVKHRLAALVKFLLERDIL